MMGGHHAISGAAAWVAVTAAAPFTLGLNPLPASSVLLGAVVTAGAALLPDLDHRSATIARSGGMVTWGVSTAASVTSGGHRHGLHSLLAVVGFTFGTTLAGRWEAVVPVFGLIPAGSALLLLALVAFSTRALDITRGGDVVLWLSAAVAVVVVLAVAPEQLEWLPTSVMIGVVVHLLGDLITTGGIPLLWPWMPRPPRAVSRIPGMRKVWRSGGYLALPVLGNAGSKREWVLCAGLSVYALYGLAASAGVLGAP
ncbi:metal-dependent hydrolase [Pengzhenrongella frigida]|uniref:Metal-dependent hydrolase n=1 Tax=Pengzhenrongella frigida TaxID=1259133 RepID=A0A4Q5N0L7_9MICO|nr:metal-dependent hydrolase [Cellulomonas sp. HLT2-17]RYV51580.1 metal-dependent hydrolase [Cellulomonas sp. HLT2-17]